uniref:Uncharacterized protein n=1 Tax=Phytophthora fragariae TaxID=53985 RepID=A0A6A3E1V4_9STRA|nr:hypothetical protein PF009_g24984 [Phytophthora fragariae]
MKGRFVVNPFLTVPLAPTDQSQLHDLAISLVKTGLERYTAFIESDQRRVDSARWKLVKSRENARVFMEKSVPHLDTQDLPSLLCVGTTPGQLEDLMFGVVNPTLEVMRIKASFPLTAGIESMAKLQRRGVLSGKAARSPPVKGSTTVPLGRQASKPPEVGGLVVVVAGVQLQLQPRMDVRLVRFEMR